MLGAAGVGKTSLCAQFLSSDHINTYDRAGKFYLPILYSKC
jgi:GTPase SAR1 family protein